MADSVVRNIVGFLCRVGEPIYWRPLQEVCTYFSIFLSTFFKYGTDNFPCWHYTQHKICVRLIALHVLLLIDIFPNKSKFTLINNYKLLTYLNTFSISFSTHSTYTASSSTAIKEKWEKHCYISDLWHRTYRIRKCQVWSNS